MKKPIALACLVLLAALASGCASLGSGTPSSRALIDQALDATLPPSFTGPAKVRHRNPYFPVEIEAEGLKRTELGWTWRWRTYRREGRVSESAVTLGAIDRK